jgi:hypothetical protein
MKRPCLQCIDIIDMEPESGILAGHVVLNRVRRSSQKRQCWNLGSKEHSMIGTGVDRIRSFLLSERVRPHLLPLAIVLVAATIGQVATLIQMPLAVNAGDTHSYLVPAQQMVQSPRFIIQVDRTPAYPVLLALVFNAVGGVNLDAVAIVQVGVLLLTIFELYLLAYRITSNRWIASAATSVVGVNLYFLAWEHMVLTEALSFCSIVTLFLCLEMFVRRPDTRSASWFAGASLLAIMVRPTGLLLPPLLLALLLAWSFWVRDVRRYLRPVLVSSAVLGVCLFGYMVANATQNGLFGISWIQNINLFGKVMEYHMQDLPVPAKYAALQVDVDRYIQNDPPRLSDPWPYTPPDPWKFVQTHDSKDGPGMTWNSGYALVGGYAQVIIKQNIGVYLMDSIPDIIGVWSAAPIFYAPYGAAPDGSWKASAAAVPGITGYYVIGRGAASNQYEPNWVNIMLVFSTIEQDAYMLLPILLIIVAFSLLSRPRRKEPFLLLAILLMGFANIVLTALASYSELYRIRSPLDIEVIAVTVIVGCEILGRLVLGKRPNPEEIPLLAPSIELASTLVIPRQQVGVPWWRRLIQVLEIPPDENAPADSTE